MPFIRLYQTISQSQPVATSLLLPSLPPLYPPRFHQLQQRHGQAKYEEVGWGRETTGLGCRSTCWSVSLLKTAGRPQHALGKNTAGAVIIWCIKKLQSKLLESKHTANSKNTFLSINLYLHYFVNCLINCLLYEMRNYGKMLRRSSQSLDVIFKLLLFLLLFLSKIK